LTEIRWLTLETVLALHDEVLAVSGGSSGVLRQSLLESALARPRHRASYTDDFDVFDLAAACSWGIVRNHPFMDANKRTALVVIPAFLEMNGHRFAPDVDDAVETMVRVARSELDEPALAAWIRAHARPLQE
jgi:death on curing protein